MQFEEAGWSKLLLPRALWLQLSAAGVGLVWLLPQGQEVPATCSHLSLLPAPSFGWTLVFWHKVYTIQKYARVCSTLLHKLLFHNVAQFTVQLKWAPCLCIMVVVPCFFLLLPWSEDGCTASWAHPQAANCSSTNCFFSFPWLMNWARLGCWKASLRNANKGKKDRGNFRQKSVLP